MSPLLLGTIMAVLVGSVTADLQCLDEDGKPVDWYVLYKLPVMNKSKDLLLRKGLAYMYITSSQSSADWKLSTLSVNDSRSIPGRTVGALYDGKSNNVLHFLYNDDPPSSGAGSIYGHTKGVVLADTTGGVWLVHSVPKYPVEPVSPKTKTRNKYQYPKTGTRYGQSFLCISLPTDQLNILGGQLMFNRPKIYSFNVPDALGNQYLNLTSAARSRFINKAPWSQKAVLKSRGGTKFTSYAKAAAFGMDLYSGWVAPDIGSDLQVETWSNGVGELPSECKTKFHVMDVLDIAVKLNNSLALQFKNSQDHSKWAVSGPTQNILCIGDINRMASQFTRGGGTVCLQNSDLWKRFSKAILDVQPCPAG